MSCIDGRGNRTDHRAEGWLCAPDGSRIVSMCRMHAEECIQEYADKLGEHWTFAEGRE